MTFPLFDNIALTTSFKVLYGLKNISKNKLNPTKNASFDAGLSLRYYLK